MGKTLPKHSRGGTEEPAEPLVRGVDGYPDFNALHSGRHDDEVELIAFDILTRAFSALIEKL